jgi:microsomal dipeptidase-like Zn-dependent dipeptidase
MIPIFDIHCHPPLKVYLCNAQFDKAHRPTSDFIPGGMHVDLPGMETGDVKFLFATHYVPESGMKHMRKSAWLFRVLRWAGLKITHKFEPDSGSECFEQTLDSIQRFNNQVAVAQDNFKVAVVKDLVAFEQADNQGQTILMHGLEGAHHLGKGLTDDQYIINLARLKQEGVCILTLAHFFPNAICGSAGGIPPKEAALIGYERPAPTGLTSAGNMVVEWCQEHGIIIDLVHSTVETRKEVYAILDKRKTEGKTIRPVVFSHTGVRIMVDPNMLDKDDHFILPDTDEVLKIQSCGGILGMILMNYWQNGDEDQDSILVSDEGIEPVIKTMLHIKELTRTVDNIAIGTDLDGFTQVPSDARHIRYIDKLRQAIIKEFGQADAEKICYKNAIRVLAASWT